MAWGEHLLQVVQAREARLGGAGGGKGQEVGVCPQWSQIL